MMGLKGGNKKNGSQEKERLSKVGKVGLADENSLNSEEERNHEVDINLEVPMLKVNSIVLDVDDLDAKLDVEVNAMNLVEIDSGLRAQINKVDLKIEDVRAEAYLKVKLGEVEEIMMRLNDLLQNHSSVFTQSIKKTAGKVDQEF